MCRVVPTRLSGVTGNLRQMTTTRLEAFSDGVFAIAATLLILNVHANSSHLGQTLVRAWPSYAAYAVSFVTIGIMWVNHHGIFAQIDKVDRTFLMINVFFLMSVAFVPFRHSSWLTTSTTRASRSPPWPTGSRSAATAVLYNLLWFYAARGRHLLRDDADPRVVSGITRSYLPGPWIYLAATLVALWRPAVSVVLFAAIAVFYMVESALFGRREVVSD